MAFGDGAPAWLLPPEEISSYPIIQYYCNEDHCDDNVDTRRWKFNPDAAAAAVLIIISLHDFLLASRRPITGIGKVHFHFL